MSEEFTKITQGHIKERLATLKNTPVSASEERLHEKVLYLSPYIEAASVLVFFDPEKIKPVKNEIEKSKKEIYINELIGASELVTDTGKYDSRIENSQNESRLSNDATQFRTSYK